MTLPVGVKPMLAGKLDLTRLVYPLLMQPKIDGIRAIIHKGQALSRTLKPIPNQHVQGYFRGLELTQGLDGELIVGNYTDKGSFQTTTSGIMSEGGTPDFTYHVFDTWMDMEAAAIDRLAYAVQTVKKLQDHGAMRVVSVPTQEVLDEEELQRIRTEYAEAGYEGIIVRFMNGLYKYGRSTSNEGHLLKWKEWVDEEGVVVGFEELMHNDNEATIDERGYTKRSTHKANKRPGNMLGALVVRCPNYNGTVNVGSGYDTALRQKIWDNKQDYLGKWVKFKHFPIGQKDLPRHPIYLGFRDPIDM